MRWGSKIPLCRHENLEKRLSKIQAMPFKDLPCILRSSNAFSTFSILATQLTGFQMSCKNKKSKKLQQSIDSNGLFKCISILLVLLVLLKYGNIEKTEVAKTDVFCKIVVLTIFWRIKGSCMQFQQNARKIFLNKFTFNKVTFQVFFQEFYLDFNLLLLLHFRFPRARIFQNNSFSYPFIVAGLGITRKLTR